MKNKLLRAPRILSIFCLLIILTSCAQNPSTSLIVTPDSSISNEIIYESASNVILPSFYELAQFSEVVVLGKVDAESGVINTARSPTDPAVPDPRYFTVAQVYQVQIEEYLQGSGPKTIYLTQKQGKLFHGKTPTAEDIRSAREQSASETYQPLQVGVRYLFFLRSASFWPDYKAAGFNADRIYVRTADPWRFNAQNLDYVYVEDKTEELITLFPPQPLSSILAQINDPTTAKSGAAYPPPPAPYP